MAAKTKDWGVPCLDFVVKSRIHLRSWLQPLLPAKKGFHDSLPVSGKAAHRNPFWTGLQTTPSTLSQQRVHHECHVSTLNAKGITLLTLVTKVFDASCLWCSTAFASKKHFNMRDTSFLLILMHKDWRCEKLKLCMLRLWSLKIVTKFCEARSYKGVTEFWLAWLTWTLSDIMIVLLTSKFSTSRMSLVKVSSISCPPSCLYLYNASGSATILNKHTKQAN